MDDALLLASRLLLLLAGAGGAIAVLIAAGRRRIGWLPALAAAAILVEFACAWLVAADLPAWALEVLSLPWFIGFPLLAATFPDGRFVPRWSIWLVVVSVLVCVVDAATGFALRMQVWWVIVAVAQGVTAAVIIAMRYRRSATTREREGVRWVLLGLLVTVTLYQLIALTDGVIGSGAALSDAKANLAVIPLLLGLIVGIAAPRLWNVDAVFRVALIVMGAGWVLIGLYSAVLAMGATPAWGAAAVAAAAYPAVRWTLRASTWLVYRERLDPDAAAARLAAALEADDPRGIAQRVVDVSADSTGSPLVRLDAAATVDDAVFSAATGADSAPAGGASFPVVFRGELLATLSATARAGESELSARDRATLTAIAQHAAPALHGARALREATTAQAALVAAREEERRALRRELHDDIGPALSGLALSAAAIARRADAVAPDLAATARELQDDIADAVERARQISHGLRPPVLDDGGLEAALRDRVDDGVELRIGVLGELPAAVDLAALRIVQEAVTNVRRHAAASVCRVSVDREPAGLRVEIADDGIGMAEDLAPGLGLRSIRERAAELGGRARVSAVQTGGTVVSVWLPIGAAR